MYLSKAEERRMNRIEGAVSKWMRFSPRRPPTRAIAFMAGLRVVYKVEVEDAINNVRR